MSENNEFDDLDDINEMVMSIGFGFVWFFSLVAFAAPGHDYPWWYSFPFIVVYAFIGAISSPLVAFLYKFVYRMDHFNRPIRGFSIVIWPISLFVALMAGFFVSMGRLAR